MRKLAITSMLLLLVSAGAAGAVSFPVRTLNGNGNNLRHADWGRADTRYLRAAAANYADGVAEPVSGPPARYVSNRIFNDVGQNLFSENGVSQFAWTWGQFLDHDFGLRDGRAVAAERAPLAFGAGDPLEQFRNDFGTMDFFRTPAAPGTGVGSARQHINTISSYIDGSGVYGVDRARVGWIRSGARLLLTARGYLPRATARGDAATAPAMDLFGALTRDRAAVAGDVRANENIALTAMHTLFAREHNRVVAALPSRLSAEDRFQIARRVVGAELQFITYTEFLPALGVRLGSYPGYRPNVNAGLRNEFAVVGYRAHSMIHGEFEPTVPGNRYTAAQLAAFTRQGIVVKRNDNGTVRLEIPLVVAFGNPQLLEDVGLGAILAGLADEAQYKNDEQIDNSLRSVLFKVPKPGIADPSSCFEGGADPDCFEGVVDLGAIDIERGRDHGMPSYNALRRAYGLARVRTFTGITRESTSAFPVGSLASNPIDDPAILDFVALRDDEGKAIPLGGAGADESATVGVRRTTVAARLRALYGANVDRLDAFVGMVSERHVRGTEFGPLQLAMWKRQFQALRDGDRFFFRNDLALHAIEQAYGITYRHTLAQVIRLNTGVKLQQDVFEAGD